MPIFEYNALKNNKIPMRGKIEAENLRDARKQLLSQGLAPTRIEEVGVNKKGGTSSYKKRVAGSIPALSLKDKIDFTQTLQTLSSTGISIIETLAFVEKNADSKNVRRCAMELKKQIIGGSTFAETLGRYRRTFGNT